MMIQNLLEWHNLFFALSILLAFVLIALSMLGSLGDGDVGVGHDIGVDHDADVNHDVSSPDGNNLPHDIPHDIEGGHNPSFLSSMMSALGVGRAPLSILIFCWLVLFGFVGLVLNFVWDGDYPSIKALMLRSAGIALITSLVLTALLAKGLGKLFPKTESYVEKLSDFINREAEVRFTVTTTSGTITLYDKYGNLQTLMAKRDVSCNDDIPANTKVIIKSYSSQEGVCYIIPAKK